MSNIRTLADLERTENTQPLPSSWAETSYPVYQDVREYGLMSQIRAQYVNCNGELVATEPSDTPGRVCCLICCPCCVDPCGEKRLSEYRKAFLSFTVPISIIQITMFIASLIVGHGFVSWKDNPMLGPGSDAFLTLGAAFGPYIRGGQVYRLVTPILLHAGIIHLLMNLTAQLRFGLYLERKWGTLKFVVIYIVSGIGASLLSCLVNFLAISVGASGALVALLLFNYTILKLIQANVLQMGLLGAYLAEVLLTWHKTNPTQRLIMLVQTVMWLTITMMFGLSKHVDTGAHLGGALTGFLLGLCLFAGEERNQTRIRIAFVVGIILTVTYFILTFTLLYTLEEFGL